MADNKVLMATNIDKPLVAGQVQTITPVIPGGSVQTDQTIRPILQSPDTTQVVISDAANIQSGTRQTGVLGVQQDQARRSHHGKRQKRYDFEVVTSAGTPTERQQLSELRGRLHASTQGLFALKDSSPEAYKSGVDRATEEIATALAAIYHTGRKAKTNIPATMHRGGLDRLLVEAFAAGKVVGARTFLAELQTKRLTGLVQGDDLKVALRAFDALCQRLVLVGGPGELQYSAGPSNLARNLMHAFASALHR